MLDKDVLYDLYVTQNLTTTEIASLMEVRSSQTISNWLRKYEIPIRDNRQAQRPVIPGKDVLHDLYVTQRMSIDAIARQVGSSEIGISRLLKEYEISIRPRTEITAGWNKGIPLSKQQCQKMSDIAKKRIGVKAPRYGAILTTHTRKKIAGSLKGKYRRHLNPNWRNGGTTVYRRIVMGQFEYADWRKFVYKRDNYICQMCNKPSNGDIQAHHIHPVRINPERILDVSNGITLCVSCHRFIHGREAEYINQFESIIHHQPPTQ